MNLYVAKVIWYDETGPATDYLTLAAECHTDAMATLEDLFRDTIETASVTLINPNGAYVLIDEEIYKGIMERGVC